jgi:lysophospholipase L1-like esterase
VIILISMKSIFSKLLLLISSLIFAVVVTELVLSMFLGRFNSYYPWKPNMLVELNPAQEYLPGIYGKSVFQTNSYGLRGDEIPTGESFKILAIGGSTTECLYLDQRETWTHLLQEKLKESDNWDNVWIGNSGKSGLSTRHYILQMKHLLAQIPDINRVIVLPGINDLSNLLSTGDPDIYKGKEEKDEHVALTAAFDVMPRYEEKKLPFFKRTRIWFLLTKAKFLIAGWNDIQNNVGSQLKSQREFRQNAKIYIDELPVMDSAISLYKERLNIMVDEVQKKGSKIIFLTQPSLWKDGMKEEVEKLLWFGWMGGKWGSDEYYSIKALIKGLENYNKALLEVCRERNVDCVDLASDIPKDTSVFYDDVHFNEGGARQVADILEDYFLPSSPPIL